MNKDKNIPQSSNLLTVLGNTMIPSHVNNLFKPKKYITNPKTSSWKHKRQNEDLHTPETDLRY